MALSKIVVTKKAQSALEFLTTYGWAFLVILIMIGALSYFGVLDPGKFLPDKCVFGPGIGSCTEQRTTATNISFKIINSLGGDVYIQQVYLTGVRGVAGTCAGTNATASLYIPTSSTTAAITGPRNVQWPVGQVAEVGFNCTIAVGERVQSTQAVIQYQLLGGTYYRTVEGDLAVKRTI